MGGVERRLRRLEAETPAVRTEEEIGAEACRRMTTEDLLTLGGTCRRLLDLGDDWDALTEEEREAHEAAPGRGGPAAQEVPRG